MTAGRGIRRYLGWFRQVAAGQGIAMAGSVLANLAGVGLSLFFVYVCKCLIDIATGESGRNLLPWSFVLVAVMVLQIVFSLLRTGISAQLDIRIKNGLRHSAATYYLALTKNAYLTAEQMGHAVDVLKQHYNGLAREKDAIRYFDIMPEN